MKLAIMTKEEFEATIGKTFATLGTTKGCAYSTNPIHDSGDGSQYHGVVIFDSYEDYLKYMEDSQ